MDFKEQLNNIQSRIKKEKLKLILQEFKPIFSEISDRALKHMKEEGIEEIKLSITNLKYGKSLVFRNDGKFYDGHERATSLSILSEIYAAESDYIAGCADQRYYTTPPVEYCMANAARDFRESVKKSLADVL